MLPVFKPFWCHRHIIFYINNSSYYYYKYYSTTTMSKWLVHVQLDTKFKTHIHLFQSLSTVFTLLSVVISVFAEWFDVYAMSYKGSFIYCINHSWCVVDVCTQLCVFVVALCFWVILSQPLNKHRYSRTRRSTFWLNICPRVCHRRAAINLQANSWERAKDRIWPAGDLFL